MKLPSVITIETRLHIDRMQAKLIRGWLDNANELSCPAAIDNALERINSILHGHGVEAIEGQWVSRYYQTINLLYVNLGDTYDCTVVFDTLNDRFIISSWGDIVERDERRFSN